MRRLPARRHPDQVLVAGMLAVAGLSILFGGPIPGSVSATLPRILVYTWSGSLVLGGVLIVVAALVRSSEIGLYLELVAHPPMAVTMIVYAASAFLVGGRMATVAAAILTAFALARLVRTVQVAQTLIELRKNIERGGA